MAADEHHENDEVEVAQPQTGQFGRSCVVALVQAIPFAVTSVFVLDRGERDVAMCRLTSNGARLDLYVAIFTIRLWVTVLINFGLWLTWKDNETSRTQSR